MGRIASLLLFGIGISLWSQAMHSCACDFADDETARGRNEMSSSGLDKSEGAGNSPKCRGAKCECPDSELKERFYRTVGHVVANCRLNKVHREILRKYNMKLNSILGGQSFSTSQTERYKLHDEACQMMKLIGHKYKNGDFDDQVNSCCDYRERTTTFQCLHTYLTLDELKMAETEQTGKTSKKDDLAKYLESLMAEKCDKMFKSPSSLINGMKNQLEGMKKDAEQNKHKADHETEDLDNAKNEFGEGGESKIDKDGAKLDMVGDSKPPKEEGKEGFEDKTDSESKPKTGKGGRKNGEKSGTKTDKPRKGRKGRKGDKSNTLSRPSLVLNTRGTGSESVNNGINMMGSQDTRVLGFSDLLESASDEYDAINGDMEPLLKSLLSGLKSLGDD